MSKNIFNENAGRGWFKDNERHREARLYGKASKKRLRIKIERHIVPSYASGYEWEEYSILKGTAIPEKIKKMLVKNFKFKEI